jgi:hypothetical protein
MIESGYYPPGAEFDPRAPWNQYENPEEEFEVTISQSLSKNTTVFTSDYSLEIDYDEDGGYRNIDTTETKWKDVYEDEYHTPEQLIRLFKTFLKENMDKGIIFRSKVFMNSLIEECDGWCVDDYEIVEN